MTTKKIKVMVFGTFDIMHPGHLYFLAQARALGDYLVVSVARDANVKKFKGALPVFSERDRHSLVVTLKPVDRAVLGEKSHYLPHVLKEKPDIIALGYDQRAYEKELRADISSGNLRAKIVRLKPYKKHIYKSGKYRQKIRTHRK